MRHRFSVQPGVLVVALDVASREVFMVRPTRELDGRAVELLELPGGGIEAGESPLAAAKRELLEETGVTGNQWVQLYDNDGVDPIDGRVNTQQHAFLLLDARQVQNPAAGEAAPVATLPLARLISLDKENKFNDPLTPYALRRAADWLTEHHPEVVGGTTS